MHAAVCTVSSTSIMRTVDGYIRKYYYGLPYKYSFLWNMGESLTERAPKRILKAPLGSPGYPSPSNPLRLRTSQPKRHKLYIIRASE